MQVKSLWASVMDNPVVFKKVNGWLTVFWLVLIPVCYAFGLLSSVIFISALSLYAIVTGHLSTWQAASVEDRMAKDTTEQTVQEIQQTQQELLQTEHLRSHNTYE